MSLNLLHNIAQLQDQIPQFQKQITHLQELVVQQRARIKVLEDEITRLKKLNTRPNLKPNTKPPEDNQPGTSASGSGENDIDDEPEGSFGDDHKPFH